MEQVEIEMLGLAITFRGTFNTGDILRTDAEFAKHLVKNIKVAKYTAPSSDTLHAAAEAEAKAKADAAAEAEAKAKADAAAEAEAEAKAKADADEVAAAKTKGNGKK